MIDTKNIFYSILIISSILTVNACTFVEDRSLDNVAIIDASEHQKPVVLSKKPLNTNINRDLRYQVKTGDTLGVIAAKTLGHRDKYKEIADYNNLSISSSLKIGQTLLIPNGKLSNGINVSVSPLSHPTQDLNKVTPRKLTEINELIAKEKYNQAIDWAISQQDLSKNSILQSKLIEATTKQVAIEHSQDDYSEANFLISGLLKNHSFTAINKSHLIQLKQNSLIKQHSFTAKSHLEEAKFDLSYKSLVNAYSINSKTANSLEIFTHTRNQVSENMHQKALKLYRNQQLKPALAMWDKILAIKPNDDLALVYKDRVVNLQKKLNDI